MVFEVVVRNPLVAHIWRLMPQMNVYRNWYLGNGAFVRKHPELRGYVRSYVETQDSGAAIANLFSATERLLKASMKAHGVKGPILQDTLPNLLTYCVSPKQKFLNLPSMCCDVRAIYRLNVARIGAEHGDYRHDITELRRSNWKPSDAEDPDADYLKIRDHRLLAPHQQVCAIFDRVDAETGRFESRWEPRGFAQCKTKGHDASGRVTDDRELPPAPSA